MEEKFDPRLCRQKKEDCDRRMNDLEESVKKIFDKLDEGLKRQPAWVTIVIGVLSAMCAGLAVAAVK